MSSPLSAPVELHDAIAYTFDGGAVGVVSGGSAHLGAGSNRDALEVRAIGGEGQFLLDVERPTLWLFSRGREQRFELSSEEVAYGSSGASTPSWLPAPGKHSSISRPLSSPPVRSRRWTSPTAALPPAAWSTGRTWRGRLLKADEWETDDERRRGAV